MPRYSLENFAERATKGYAYELLVAQYFSDSGCDVTHEPLKIREIGEKISPYTKGQKDLSVNGFTLEVKSRTLEFSEESYPYATVFVETVDGFKKKTKKPDFYVFVSQKTGCMLFLRTDPESWSVKKTFDRARKTPETVYEARKELLRPISVLAELVSTKREVQNVRKRNPGKQSGAEIS